MAIFANTFSFFINAYNFPLIPVENLENTVIFPSALPNLVYYQDFGILWEKFAGRKRSVFFT